MTVRPFSTRLPKGKIKRTADWKLRALPLGTPDIFREIRLRIDLEPMSAFVQVFGRRQSRINPPARAAGGGKAPRQEIAVGSSAAVRRALWGFSRGAGVEVGQKQVRRSVCCKP